MNSAENISCSSDLDITRLVWMLGRIVIASTSSQQLDLIFDPVNDTIHNAEYTCEAISPYGMQEQTVMLQSEGTCNYMIIKI